MATNVSTRCKRCTCMVDMSDGRCPICGATADDFVKGHERRNPFGKLTTYSEIVGRLQWDAAAVDLCADVSAWQQLPQARQERLTSLLCSFCVCEEAVAAHLQPFTSATNDTLLAWVLFLQRRDEDRHALFFDRVAAEVLRLPGDTPAQRREAARPLVDDRMLELFESTLPSLAADLADGVADLQAGVSLYHTQLEGVIFSAGQKALLADLADGALPGVRDGIRRIDLDERWHIGLGLRCLYEAQPTVAEIEALKHRAGDVIEVWGDLVPPAITQEVLNQVSRRLGVIR